MATRKDVCKCGQIKSSSAQLCSKCFNLTRRNRVEVICPICGDSRQFKPSDIRKHPNRSCGKPECKKQHQINVMREIGRNRASKTPRIEVACACGCGEMSVRTPSEILPGQRHFVNADHRAKFRDDRNNIRGLVLSGEPSGQNRYGRGWTKIRERIRNRDKVCQVCGKTPQDNGRALAVHHIIAFRISGDNSDENLMAVCGQCHTKFTHVEIKTLPPLPLPKPRHKKPESKNCLICGTEFVARSSRHKLCSKACANEYMPGFMREYNRFQKENNTDVYQRMIARRDEVNRRVRERRLLRRGVAA